MKKILCFVATALTLVAFSPVALADSYAFLVNGSGVSGQITLTYGAATDARYSQAYQVTGISGTFSDANIGIFNAGITGLVDLNRVAPEPTNKLAPNDFSAFAVASGLPPENQGNLHYDNLFYPGGSPQTASDYPFHGGFFDIYGLLFKTTGGQTVNLWSNGVTPGTSSPNYGVAVVTHAQSLDYVGVAVAPTPEPASLWLLGTGLAAVLGRRRLLRKA